MKIRILLGIIGLFSFGTFAQNVIRIRPQHQKEHLYTLKEGERFGRNESNLEIRLDGADYEFMTMKGEAYYKHTRAGKKKFIGKRYTPTIFKNWRVVNNNGKTIIKNRFTQQSYGPMLPPSLHYDSSIKLNPSGTYVSTKSDLFGFKYFESAGQNGFTNWNHFVVKPGEEPKGPFLNARINVATDKEFVFTFDTNEGQFLSINDKIYGPYDQIHYRRYMSLEDGVTQEKELFTYKEGEVWKMNEENLSDYTFSQRPSITNTIKGDRLYLRIIEKENKYFEVLPDGSLQGQGKQFFVATNNTQEDLVFKCVDDTTFQGVMIKYLVSFKGKELGEYHLISNSNKGSYTKNSDYFRLGLIPADSLVSNQNYNQVIYFSPTLGFTKPIQSSSHLWVHLLDDGYAIHNTVTDSLEFKGKFYSDVMGVDFIDYPKTWWMLREEGDIDQPYKNGVLTNALKNMPKNWKSYDTPDKPFVLIPKDEAYFLKTRKKKKIYGPVEKYSNIILSDDEQNYIECKHRDNTIWINNKLISTGFYVVYNNKMDAFHWLSITEENKIYLHTYELN